MFVVIVYLVAVVVVVVVDLVVVVFIILTVRLCKSNLNKYLITIIIIAETTTNL